MVRVRDGGTLIKMVGQTWYKADKFKMPLDGNSIGVSDGWI